MRNSRAVMVTKRLQDKPRHSFSCLSSLLVFCLSYLSPSSSPQYLNILYAVAAANSYFSLRIHNACTRTNFVPSSSPALSCGASLLSKPHPIARLSCMFVFREDGPRPLVSHAFFFCLCLHIERNNFRVATSSARIRGCFSTGHFNL